MHSWDMDGAKFKGWREKFHLTQAEVAIRFQVSRNTVQNWEGADGPLPIIVQQGCLYWGHRLNQLNPNIGPVTLGYMDGPTFVQPGQRFGVMQSEVFRTNKDALLYVRQRYGQSNFVLPFIRVGEFGEELWNPIELGRVATGDDEEAP